MSTDTTRAEPTIAAAEVSVALDGAPRALRGTLTNRAVAVWQRLEWLLIRGGDWLNPILVKETRQALKSFQFTATFVLVLIFCWIVTVGVVAWIGPSISYAAAGGTLLLWYYAVLAVPLMIVVPLASFMSLAFERQDNTYDLLSITTLKPRQIISGKLGSSVVQMAVYFSAITPCLAFTYLLRGVDLPTIMLLMAYAFFGSLGLCMIGILMATLVVQRFALVLMLVAFVGVEAISAYLVAAAGYSTAYYSFQFVGGDTFWTVLTAFATFYITFFALAFFAATGMITFTSENRSTPLRIAMLVQQAAFIGWMSYAWIESDFEKGILLVMATFSGIYWFAMGAMVTAERPGISQRVRRRLPKSFLGRVLFTWLNPGPGTGYMFVVANATTILLLCLVGDVISNAFSKSTRGWPSGVDLLYLIVVGWAYLVAYLGLGLIVVRLLRRLTLVTMLASVLIDCLLVLAGSGIPAVIQSMSIELRDRDYSLLQITNPFWSMKHLSEGGSFTDGEVLVLVVPAAAFVMLLLNLGTVIRELQAVRVAPPPRVIEDEAELHPAPVAGPTNPWDE